MSDAIDAANDAFHASFDANRDEAASSGPILVVVADDLVLVQDATRTTFSFTPPLFHVAKGIAHAPVALWLMRRRVDTARLPALRASIVASLEALPAELVELRPLLEATLAAIDAPTVDFAKALGGGLERSIAIATKIQLAALHARTEEIFATLSKGDLRKLHVAVTGDHQARERSLGMQYFARRLGGERVLYAEGVEDVERAVQLVAANRLDRALALAFFGDPKRLQRDVLGDAAKTELASFQLP